MKPATIAFFSGGIEIQAPFGVVVESGFANAVEAHDWCDEHGYDPYANLSEGWKRKNREWVEKRRQELNCTDLPLFAGKGGLSDGTAQSEGTG